MHKMSSGMKVLLYGHMGFIGSNINKYFKSIVIVMPLNMQFNFQAQVKTVYTLGFIAFMMFFATSAFHAGRFYFRTDDENQLILLPIAMAIIKFLAVKAVASTESSMPIVIMLVGFSFGMAARIMKSQPERNQA